MSYIDQITVDSTTYDIQDSNAQRKTLEGSGAPTTSTVGTLGAHYFDTSATEAPYEYICVDISEGSYTWEPVGSGSEMVVLSYGQSTWAEFEAAYNTNSIVYCRASSNSNPATGAQTRMAFMAYVNANPPTEVEFQYYRSVGTHTASQQGDQVFVYKLTKTGGWTVTTREASAKVVAGTGLGSSYSSDTLTLTANVQTVDGKTGAVSVIPSGGTTGQVLKKSSATDYAVEWANESGSVTSVDGKTGAVSVIPSGGTQGQFLKKASSTDYAVEWDDADITEIYYGTTQPTDPDIKVWIDPSGTSDAVLPTGGTTGQVLAKTSATNYDVGWTDTHSVPSGGMQGQVLTKSSATDYDAAWADASGGGPLIVTVSCSSYQDGSRYSIDSTYNDIVAAIQSGREVILKAGVSTTDYYYLEYTYSSSGTISAIRFSRENLSSSDVFTQYRFSLVPSYQTQATCIIREMRIKSFLTTESFTFIVESDGSGGYSVSNSTLNAVTDLYDYDSTAYTGSLAIFTGEVSDNDGNHYKNFDTYPLVGVNWTFEYESEEWQDWLIRAHISFSKVVVVNGTNYNRTVTVSWWQWFSADTAEVTVTDTAL